MSNQSFTTERLFIDRITERHVPILLKAINSPELEYSGFIDEGLDGADKFENRKIYTEKDMQELVQMWSSAKKSKYYGIFLNESKLMVGHYMYDYGWDTHFVFAQLIIYPGYWHLGYGKEIAPLILNQIFDLR